MIKFILKSLVFIIVIFLLINTSDSLFINKQRGFEWLSATEVKERNKVELAFFGSSHSYCTYDPRVFEDKLNLNTFNFGGASQNLYVTESVIKQAIKTAKIKLAVVDVFSVSLYEPPLTMDNASHQFRSIDYLDLTKDKISLMNTLFGRDSILHVFPTIRDHAVWYDRVFQQPNVLKEKDSYYNGFITNTYFDKNFWRKNVKVRKDKISPKLVPNIQLSNSQKKLIDNIIKLFEEQKIPVLFVSAPVFNKAQITEENANKYYTYQVRLAEYLKGKGYNFIDYNNLWDELNLHVFDFREKSHLNFSGALKVSSHLADYISKHYNFKDGGQKLREYPENVYYLLKTNYSNTLFNAKIKDKKFTKLTGIEDIALYKDKYGRLELIMRGEEIKKIKIKVTYEMPTYQARNLPTSIAKKIKNGKYNNQKELSNLKEGSTFTGLRYNDKEFKIFTIDCPFSEINDLRINVVKNSYSKELISIDNLKLN
ncbi:hypothetical protein DI383_08735 [Flavobacteriaceae bacterium LYZ1037]|nr:hypothetical protein DI383_08735 [Flavobacteriaceae bacterium LYZ1037]